MNQTARDRRFYRNSEIQRLRSEHGLSVRDIASLVGCGKSTVAAVLRGERVHGMQPPKVEISPDITIEQIADRLADIYGDLFLKKFSLQLLGFSALEITDLLEIINSRCDQSQRFAIASLLGAPMYTHRF